MYMYKHIPVSPLVHVLPHSAVQPEYFCHLDHKGMRTDAATRPELTFGSVEFTATTDYCKVHNVHVHACLYSTYMYMYITVHVHVHVLYIQYLYGNEQNHSVCRFKYLPWQLHMYMYTVCSAPYCFLFLSLHFLFLSWLLTCQDGRVPKAPAYIFLLDVSAASVSSGLLALISQNILTVCDHLPE